MLDKELYEQILSLSKPWVVKSVELDKEQEKVVIKVDLKGPVILCSPECKKPMPGY